MDYLLKNGISLTIRPPVPEDAQGMVELFRAADEESPFLIRNPGEFDFTVEQESALIKTMEENPDLQWYTAFCQGRLVGQSSAGLVNGRWQRCRHRAQVGFVVLKAFWGLGIGGRLMENCLAWCREHGVEQVELDVVAGNQRALDMYKSFGFEVVGLRPRALKYPDGTYAGETAMIKYL
ncbi:GNAT family N-acetyltransferase [Oscillospiraceae bacterium 42-9]